MNGLPGKMKRLRRSFACAFRGLFCCIRRERNLRIHLTAACYVALLARLGELNAHDCAVLALCCGCMIAAELLNTAVERLCDRVTAERDSMIRDAKDIAAGGVLACAIACVIVGVCLFLPSGALQTALLALRAPAKLIPALLSIPLAFWFVFYAGRA